MRCEDRKYKYNQNLKELMVIFHKINSYLFDAVIRGGNMILRKKINSVKILAICCDFFKGKIRSFANYDMSLLFVIACAI